MEIVFVPSDRLLVFAPHPDDESLACGGLIQRALASGAQVHVVIATNGDSNPWPQRWSERRWRLDTDAITRWAALRTGEARAALRTLGVAEDNVEFLQWRDQGLTARLVHDGETSVAQLRALLRQHKPTCIAMPSVLDSHPDHSALAILLKAALRAEGSTARLLSYWLHGRGSRPIDAPMQLTLTPTELAAKRAAALSHGSQAHFGTSRLLRFVDMAERFLQPSAVLPQSHASWHWQFKARSPLALAATRRLRVIAISATGTLHAAALELRGASRNDDLQTARRGPRTLDVVLAPLWPEPAWVVAKLDTDHRINVYDDFAWSDRRPPLRGSEPAPLETPPQAHLHGILGDVAVKGTEAVDP